MAAKSMLHLQHLFGNDESGRFDAFESGGAAASQCGLATHYVGRKRPC